MKKEPGETGKMLRRLCEERRKSRRYTETKEGKLWTGDNKRCRKEGSKNGKQQGRWRLRPGIDGKK